MQGREALWGCKLNRSGGGGRAVPGGHVIPHLLQAHNPTHFTDEQAEALTADAEVRQQGEGGGAELGFTARHCIWAPLHLRKGAHPAPTMCQDLNPRDMQSCHRF